MASNARLNQELRRIMKILESTKFALQPVYNRRIPDVTEVAGNMQLKERTTGHLKDILKFLPDSIVAAIEQHADMNGMTDAQVLELAIVNLLDLDKTAISDVKDLPDLLSLAMLREENAILRAQMKAAGIGG